MEFVVNYLNFDDEYVIPCIDPTTKFEKNWFSTNNVKLQDLQCSLVSPLGFAAESGTCCRRWWSWVFRRRPGSLQTWLSASCWSCPVSGTPAMHGGHRCSSLWTKSVGRDTKLESNLNITVTVWLENSCPSSLQSII